MIVRFEHPTKRAGRWLSNFSMYEGVENPNAHILEDWALGATFVLGELNELGSNEPDVTLR
jgi:hypothetical protein